MLWSKFQLSAQERSCHDRIDAFTEFGLAVVRHFIKCIIYRLFLLLLIHECFNHHKMIETILFSCFLQLFCIIKFVFWTKDAEIYYAHTNSVHKQTLLETCSKRTDHQGACVQTLPGITLNTPQFILKWTCAFAFCARTSWPSNIFSSFFV